VTRHSPVETSTAARPTGAGSGASSLAVLASARHRRHVVRRPRLQQLVFDDGPGSDHLGDGAVDEPGRLLGVFDLIAEGDAVAGIEERSEVGRGVVDGDPGHRVVAGGVGALRQRHLADAGDRLGRLAERLVEVADLEQHEGVLVGYRSAYCESIGVSSSRAAAIPGGAGHRLVVRSRHTTSPVARGDKRCGGGRFPRRTTRRARALTTLEPRENP